jgi:hypothetical protein
MSGLISNVKKGDVKVNNFFVNTRPGKKVTYGELTFELPILYFRNDFFWLSFTANEKKVRSLMPSNNLYPVTMFNGKAVVAIGAFNYIDNTIGSYGEVFVSIPVIYGRKPSFFTGIITAFLESRYPGFGVLIQHLPVTNKLARDVGRKEWGFTKFIADMNFTITPEYMECRIHEDKQHILDMRIARKGFHLKDETPFVLYSVKDTKLMKTVVPHKSLKRMSLNTKGSFINFGEHPVALSVKNLEISSKPFMTAYYPEHFSILPQGVVVEDNVKPFEGYLGKDHNANHVVGYTEKM